MSNDISSLGNSSEDNGTYIAIKVPVSGSGLSASYTNTSSGSYVSGQTISSTSESVNVTGYEICDYLGSYLTVNQTCTVALSSDSDTIYETETCIVETPRGTITTTGYSSIWFAYYGQHTSVTYLQTTGMNRSRNYYQDWDITLTFSNLASVDSTTKVTIETSFSGYILLLAYRDFEIVEL